MEENSQKRLMKLASVRSIRKVVINPADIVEVIPSHSSRLVNWGGTFCYLVR